MIIIFILFPHLFHKQQRRKGSSNTGLASCHSKCPPALEGTHPDENKFQLPQTCKVRPEDVWDTVGRSVSLIENFGVLQTFKVHSNTMCVENNLCLTFVVLSNHRKIFPSKIFCITVHKNFSSTIHLQLLRKIIFFPDSSNYCAQKCL